MNIRRKPMFLQRRSKKKLSSTNEVNGGARKQHHHDLITEDTSSESNTASPQSTTMHLTTEKNVSLTQSLSSMKHQTNSSTSVRRRRSEHSAVSSSLSKGSTMTFGSSREQDSFIVASTTGLSTLDNNSKSYCHSYDPYNQYNHHHHNEEDSNSQIPFPSNTTAAPISSRRRRLLPGKGKKITSQRLPRLNIPSAPRTKALLDGSHDVSNSESCTEDLILSPESTFTKQTEPCTPTQQRSQRGEGGDFQEFPTFACCETPQIDISDHHHYETNLTVSITSSTFSSTFSSSQQDVERRMSLSNRRKLAAQAEQECWKTRVKDIVMQYGADSAETGKILCNLGNVQLKCKDHVEALSTYKRAVRILRKSYGDNSLSVAHALNKVGLAASMGGSSSSVQNLDWALIALHESFMTRYNILGPYHCDVVDTLNNIAGIYLHKRDWEKAKNSYLEVLTVRSAIFGRNHPSVAVTAHTLGRVYSSLSEFELALKYMDMALQLYRMEPMCLKDGHPLVIKVQTNIDSTRRLMWSLGSSNR